MRDTVMRDIDTAFLAVGGSEFNKARCQCDHDVGHFPCEYCAIRDALCVCRREITRLRAEIALLRLTHAERAFLRRLQPRKLPFASYSTVISPEDRKTVFALLARLGGGE